MRKLSICLLFVLATTAFAEESPLLGHGKFMYGAVQKILLRTAENMPEENYAFKPVDTVRTFGQIVGHVADAQYTFCSSAIGEKNPAPQIEKTKTSKADLIAALNEAFKYCDKAYAGMTNETATEMVKFGPNGMPRLGVLNVNTVHAIEHYGNLVTYTRMKNLVPPTSDPEFMKSMR